MVIFTTAGGPWCHVILPFFAIKIIPLHGCPNNRIGFRG
jgi:hypothetical protein